MALLSSDRIQVFLLLAKNHLPLSFPALSRHANTLDSLFLELVGQINTDSESAKLRTALCMISRKQSDFICQSTTPN